ncbi:MAG: hypothetical protein ACQEXX_20080 [Bacillota bacterium]
MDIKWIEEAVKERVVEVTRECDEQTAKSHDILICIINSLRNVVPRSETKTLIKLEDLYIQHQSICIDLGYRRGLSDGMQVHKICNDTNKTKYPL